MISPGIKVVNMSSMKIKSKMADTYINKIKQGNKVLITIPDLNKEIVATVSFTGSTVDAISRTFNVEVAIANNELKPNMLINMKINDASIAKAIVINQNLIQTSESGKFVMVAEKNGNKVIAKRLIVKTGDSYNGNVIITEGLNVGTQLISTGYQDLIDGQDVKL
jgi:multidrug efflux pump subunit AcrA (membrane-fusion protein)